MTSATTYATLSPSQRLFVHQYIATLLWSSTDDGGNPLDDNFDIIDLHTSALDQCATECLDFYDSNVTLWKEGGWDDEQAAHDFALTRNRHGAGFWDRWFNEDKQVEQAEALDFVRTLLSAPIPHIALENPVSVISSRIRKPDQIIQPWMFGHGETKATCLWLKGLPELQATNVVEGREGRVWKLPPSPDRWKLRSITLPGVASAFAHQWGGYVANLANLHTTHTEEA